MMRRWLVPLVLGGLGTLPAPLAAQGDAAVELLAGVLAAEDARRFDQVLLLRALSDPDSSVRALAATSVGRIRDTRGLPLLAPLLADPDSMVQLAAVFALGLIGDSGVLPLLHRRVADGTAIAEPVALEVITAAARVGGAELVRAVLDRSLWGERDRPVLLWRAARESWRLGPRAPVASLLPLLNDEKEDARYGAVYSLARLRISAAAPRFVEALNDRSSAAIRAVAARALTRSMADSANLGGAVIADLLVRATRDEDAGVRINALRSLATFRSAEAAVKILPLLRDPVLNVQVQAAEVLGLLGGLGAVPELSRLASAPRGAFAVRRESLLSLARLDTAAFALQVGRWASAADWRGRAAAARGWARADPFRLAPFLGDPDGRVVASALGTWAEIAEAGDSLFLRACRRLLASRDAAVRAIAADGVATAANPADIPSLLVAYRAAARDSFPDAAIAALGAMRKALANVSEEAPRAERATLGQIERPADYVIRRWAEEHWPAAAEHWGPAFPQDPGRTLEDYRQAARQFLIGLGQERYPRVRIEVDQVGVIELELFGPEAPLTVLHFLQLVDRRFFDGQRFHRVVPNFVAQAGDPRGDGWGGPGRTIRDELNRRRYGSYMVGMALSGPDTGGSQWFITLSPQPHLDGGYTLFGRVSDGVPALLRITEGDLIRSIRR
jgi:cyclophilin family peptidyl-prolyl cis-trans isomerase/HEAT repeat protein